MLLEIKCCLSCASEGGVEIKLSEKRFLLPLGGKKIQTIKTSAWLEMTSHASGSYMCIILDIKIGLVYGSIKQNFANRMQQNGEFLSFRRMCIPMIK